MTVVTGCGGCATSAGVLGCPYHSPRPVGVAEVVALDQIVNGQAACAQGYHAWVPWLTLRHPELDNITGYTTWCVRCKHSESWDI